MATNFPDTSQLKDDGFPWADGDVFDDTANSGYIYYWYDPVWKTSLTQKENDDRYVNIGGDVMSGSLALTDKITLDATDGSATFAGRVTSGNLDLGATNVSGAYVNSTGAVVAQRPSAEGTSELFQVI